MNIDAKKNIYFILCIGIGFSTRGRLAEHKVSTITDLLSMSFSKLITVCGESQAALITNLCKGIDSSPVNAFGKPQVNWIR